MQNFYEKYNRTIRLPVFLTGVGFLGKSIYDVANYVMTGEPLTSETAMNATTGFGFLSLASSMYLKDQDPKSLEKNPSRVSRNVILEVMKIAAAIIIPAIRLS